MINKLYITNNIKKNKASYINIMLIITISIIIINILNIYMDAVYYGDELRGQSSVAVEQVMLFNILKVVFAVIGAVSIYFIYSMFIENRKRDIGILIFLGMNRKQLKKLLFTELFIIYIISFFVALILSNILMYIIIKNFLSVDNENLVLIAYRFSFSETLFLFFISFFSVVSSQILFSEKISKLSIIQTIQNSFADKEIKRNVNVWNVSSAVKYISKANLMRNKKIFFISSILSIPALIISVVFLNYFNLFNTPLKEPDFRIGVDYIEIHNYSEIILEDIALLEYIEGIKNIEFSYYYNNFVMKVDESKLKFSASAVPGDTEHYYRVSIQVLQDYYFEGIENYNLENYVVLSENITSCKYRKGDNIFLRDNSRHDKEKIFTIAGFINMPQQGNFLNIFVTKENFEKITGQYAVPNAISIYADNDADVTMIREELYSIFDDKDLFRILDYIERRNDMSSLEKGLIITVSFLCAVIFVCVIILLWSFISFYTLNQKQQLNILRTIGAEKKAIIKITANESLIRGITNGCVGLAIGTYISYIVVKMSGYDFLINGYMFMLYGLILIITISAHFLPAFITVNRIAAEIEKGER